MFYSAVLLGGMYTRGLIFDNIIAETWLNFLDDLRYVDYTGMNCLQLDLRFTITLKKSKGVENTQRNNNILKLLLQHVHRGISYPYQEFACHRSASTNTSFDFEEL